MDFIFSGTWCRVHFKEKDSSSEVVLKKQYRKLALVLHPDKDKAPARHSSGFTLFLQLTPLLLFLGLSLLSSLTYI
ncbi:hypothetical protein BV898_17352 [Hypsibius exemplaris]|uniref:J domain-containing protein n=1 Tax=Hypsibius exemplaris TaxID=2072580 RepID=A0A9X6RMC7_HYPEX|nr:hypothetical protein BV898_17352 [Hypsibius exemplaris]